MQLSLLREKVSSYYNEYGKIPAKIKYTNDTNIGRLSNILSEQDDIEKFYVIDLEAMKGITLNYGKDYEEVNIDNSENKRWRKLTYINIYSFMQQLLYRQEMMANANNIKALSPFIDIEIVEFAYNIPYQYKYQNNTEKAILKDAYKNDLPKEITNRIKNPYPKTFSPIYEEMVNNKINELLNDPKSIINMFFKKEMILELINDKNKKIPYYGQLMTNTQFLAYLIQFEEWVKIYNIEFIINKR